MKKRFSEGRTVLLRLMLVTLAVWCSATAQAQSLKKITITQPVASFSFLPLDYAKAAGYFKDEGYDVQQVATRGAGPDLAALASGDVQFNASPGTTQVGAIRAGRDIINVYNYFSRNLFDVVISPAAAKKIGVSPNAPLKERAAALKGLTMAMTRPGAPTDKQLRHLARIGGFDENQMNIIAIGDSPSMISALERGQIDGFTISIPGGRVAIKRGAAIMWVNNANGDDPSVDPFMFQSLLTTREYAKANPHVVHGMIRALKKAVNDIATKPAEEVRKVVQPIYSSVDPETMILSIEALKPALNRKGDVTLKMAENTMRMEGAPDVTPQQLFATFTAQYQ